MPFEKHTEETKKIISGRRKKFTPEIRKKIAFTEKANSELAKEYGCHIKTIRSIKKELNPDHKKWLFKPGRKRRSKTKLSLEDYKAIAASKRTGKELAKLYGISESTVHVWRKKLSEDWDGTIRRRVDLTPEQKIQLLEEKPDSTFELGSRNELTVELDPDDVQSCRFQVGISKSCWIWNHFFDLSTAYYKRNGTFLDYEIMAAKLKWMFQHPDFRDCFEGIYKPSLFLALKNMAGMLESGRASGRREPLEMAYPGMLKISRCWIEVPDAGRVLLKQPFPVEELEKRGLVFTTTHIYKAEKKWLATAFAETSR